MAVERIVVQVPPPEIVAIAGALKEQQARIETLTERVTRLEAQIDTMLKVAAITSAGRKQIK